MAELGLGVAFKESSVLFCCTNPKHQMCIGGLSSRQRMGETPVIAFCVSAMPRKNTNHLPKRLTAIRLPEASFKAASPYLVVNTNLNLTEQRVANARAA